MRRSQDIQSYINGRELNSMSSVASPSEYDRRNLKTADRDARSPELESALLHKDIVYKGGSIGRGSVAGAKRSWGTTAPLSRHLGTWTLPEDMPVPLEDPH